MKKLILIAVLLFSMTVTSQITKVQGIGYKAISTAQRDVLSVPVNEYWRIYNSTTDRYEFWNGTAWVEFSAAEFDPVYINDPAFSITAQDLIDIQNLDGINSGDQDLSGLLPKDMDKVYTGAAAYTTVVADRGSYVTVDSGGSVILNRTGLPDGFTQLVFNNSGVDINLSTTDSYLGANNAIPNGYRASYVLDGTTWHLSTPVSAGAGATTLNDLSDTDLVTPGNGQALTYNSTSFKWENTTLAGGVTQLNNLSDVTSATVTDGFTLIANGSTYVGRAILEADISDFGTYLTSNQTITLSGAVTGTGSTSIVTTLTPVPATSLSATGRTTTNFLRGDNTWATPSGSGNVSTSGAPEINDFAKFTGSTDIEGRSYSETRLDLGLVIGTNVQAYSSILDATTASFTTTLAGNISNNNAKVTNALHTGDVAGATLLTIQPAAIDVGMLATSGTATETNFLNGEFIWTDIPSTNIGYTASTRALTSSTGSGFTFPLAVDNGDAGLLTGAEKHAIAINTTKVSNALHTGDVTGSIALTIGANRVLESHLKSVNTPTDEYALTYEATTGDFEWQANGDITGVTAGLGLSGGGASGYVTLASEFTEHLVGGTLLSTDYLMADNGNINNRQLISAIPLSIFSNTVSGFTSNAGTVTSVGGTGTVNGLTLSGTTPITSSGNILLSGALSGVTSTAITNGTIQEIDLEVTNAPVNNYILSYDSGTAGFTWVLNTDTNTTNWNVQANGGTASNVAAGEEVNFIDGNGTTMVHVNQTNPTMQVNLGPLTAAWNSGSTYSITANSFYESSDIRLKNSIIQLDDTFVKFKWDGREGYHFGVIAQEIEKSNPEMVETGDDGYLHVNYTEVLIKELVILKEKYKKLEERLIKLENK